MLTVFGMGTWDDDRYKNAQMIYSAFRHIPQLEEVLSRSFATRSASGRSREGARTPDEGKKGVDVTPIPPIRWWQETIEAAWKQGKSVSWPVQTRTVLTGRQEEPALTRALEL